MADDDRGPAEAAWRVSVSCGDAAESEIRSVGVGPSGRRLLRLSTVEEVPDEDRVVVRAEIFQYKYNCHRYNDTSGRIDG